MIRHVLCFRLVDREHDAAIRQRLTALVGVVPGLLAMDVEPDLGEVDGHWDLVLVSEHESVEALAAHQTHPEHRAAAAWVAQFVTERAVVDYAVPAAD
jgi:quinol monooxygenase YgiN